MSTVITDENDVVQDIASLPPDEVTPGWHVYFPVTENLPNLGDVFTPDLTSQPWLKTEVMHPGTTQ